MVIQPAWFASKDEVRGYFLSDVLAAVLLQHNVLPLHASAIRTERGALLFTGDAGSGKSTLLGAMLKRGYAMLSDDVTGVVFDDTGRPLALPAYPTLRLRHDSATKAGLWADWAPPQGGTGDRYAFPVTAFCSEPLPICGIYELNRCLSTRMRRWSRVISEHSRGWQAC